MVALGPWAQAQAFNKEKKNEEPAINYESDCNILFFVSCFSLDFTVSFLYNEKTVTYDYAV